MPRRARGDASGFDQKLELGETWDSVFIGFSRERQRQGRLDSLGLASLSDSGGLWAARSGVCLPISLSALSSPCLSNLTPVSVRLSLMVSHHKWKPNCL